MTPLHPLMAKVGPLTRDELLEVVRYEGLIGLSDDDAVAAIHLTAEGLIEITMLHGQPHATSLEAPWLASRESHRANAIDAGSGATPQPEHKEDR